MTKTTSKGKKIKKAGGIVKGAAGIIQGVGSILEAVGGNHPAWYEAYPLDSLIAINFGEREKVGRTIPWENYNLTSPADSKIPLALTIPTSEGKDAFRESHQIIMNKLRAATGSNVTYDIDDLICYTLNAREMVAAFTVIRRTILCTRIIDIYDSDAPYKYAMMSASGKQGTTTVPFNTLIANLATDTVRLNRLAKVIASLVPIRMNLMARTAWLFSNIFADSPTKKFSTKMFTLPETGFWSRQSDGSITRTTSALEGKTLTEMLDILEGILSSFSAQLQNSRIAGDYLKAFGGFFTQFQEIDETTRIAPIYDEAALTQIQNATFTGTSVTTQYDTAGMPYTKVDLSLEQDVTATANFDNSLRGAREVAAMYTALNQDCIVNTYKDSVSPGEALSLTRLVSLASTKDSDFGITTSGGVSTFHVKMQAVGTEVAETVQYLKSQSITTQNYADMIRPLTRFSAAADTFVRKSSDSRTSILDTNECAMFWSMDDWAPRYVLCLRTQADKPNTIAADMMVMWDYSNWGKLSKENLSTYHQVAAMSLLATPDNIVEQSKFQFI